jgi:hypothetical protein
MTITIGPGCILHWEGFKFADGAEVDKFLVIVGAHPNQNFLAIVATSKKHQKSNIPGGDSIGGYYHIPGGAKDWFKLDTWLMFDRVFELSAADLVKASFDGKVQIKGALRGEIANAICNTMRRCDDVSDAHKALLGPPFQPQKK